MTTYVRSASTIALVALTSLLGGCAAETTDDEGEAQSSASSEDALIGGKPEPENTSAMLVRYDADLQPYSLCSLSQIGGRVMLTAAHCTQEDGNAAHYKVFFGQKLADYSYANPQLAAVRAVAFDPEFNIGVLENGHDVGLVMLDQPGRANTYPINRAPVTKALVGKPALLSGYGERDRKPATFTSGQRQKLSVKLDAFFKVGKVTHGNVLEFGSSTKTSCHGDSGGPALMTVDGRTRVVGVTSFGYDSKKKECVGRGYYARVDVSLGFIDRTVARWETTLAQ